MLKYLYMLHPGPVLGNLPLQVRHQSLGEVNPRRPVGLHRLVSLHLDREEVGVSLDFSRVPQLIHRHVAESTQSSYASNREERQKYVPNLGRACPRVLVMKPGQQLPGR